LSYAPPQPASVTGCTAAADGLAVRNCSRSGGQVVTIQGFNFGPEGGRVFIGNTPCQSLEYVSHRELRCTVPPGTGLGKPVLVIQKVNPSA
jgi:hypothetical protein